MPTPSRVPTSLTNTDWTEIVVDPDAEGYTKILVDNLMNVNVFWSPENTTTIPTSILPDQTAAFDYNIFIKCLEASASNPVQLSITRL